MPRVSENQFLAGQDEAENCNRFLLSLVTRQAPSDYCKRRSARAGCRFDEALQRGEAVGQRGGAGLEDERRLDLVERAVAHRRNVLEAGTRRQLLGTEFLAAPRADDEVGLALDDLGGADDAVARRLAVGAL